MSSENPWFPAMVKTVWWSLVLLYFLFIYIRQTCWFCMVSWCLSRWICSKICSSSPNCWRLAFCRGACQSVIHLRGRGIWQTRVISPAIARNWRGSPSQKHTSMDWLKGKSAKKSPFLRVFLPAIIGLCPTFSHTMLWTEVRMWLVDSTHAERCSALPT